MGRGNGIESWNLSVLVQDNNVLMTWTEGIRRDRTNKISPSAPQRPSGLLPLQPPDTRGLSLPEPKLLAPKFSCHSESNRSWVEAN